MTSNQLINLTSQPGSNGSVQNSDRGWNDPPTSKVSYTSGKSRLLKRVHHTAVPDSSMSARSIKPCCGPPPGIVLLPPAPSVTAATFPAPILVPHMEPPDATLGTDIISHPLVVAVAGDDVGTSCDDVEIPHFSDDRQLLHYTVSRLQKVLLHCRQTLGTRGFEEVNKKLQIFEKMWDDGKISYPVKASMAKLAIALYAGKSEVAHEIHLQIMVDYIGEVASWMVGIKRLIKEAQGPYSPSRESQTKPLSLSDAEMLTYISTDAVVQGETELECSSVLAAENISPNNTSKSGAATCSTKIECEASPPALMAETGDDISYSINTMICDAACLALSCGDDIQDYLRNKAVLGLTDEVNNEVNLKETVNETASGN